MLMFTSLRFGSAILALICIAFMLSAGGAAAVTVEVARACKALTDTVYPPREPGNPAAGSAKGTGRAAQAYFNRCVANGGKMDDTASKQAK
jgi:hypothetical protein